MGAIELGPWQPMKLDDAVALFRPAPFRWWLSGGHALEAHLTRSWRSHSDTDIAICRLDAPRLREVLDGWDIHIGAAGVLTPWDGGALEADRSENNLWCRPAPDSPWMIDVTVGDGDGDGDEWIYRRDPSIRRPWRDAVLRTQAGIPYLAPELQLLFKSKEPRRKDDADATVVVPELNSGRRTWLANQLPAEHPWQTTVARTRAVLASGVDAGSDVRFVASGRSSQAWRISDPGGDRVVRVPLPNSGRPLNYRSESLVTRLLAEAGHPVSVWELTEVDDVECSIGTFLPGTPIDPTWIWPQPFVERFAAVLRDLHQLPATGWGPLENRSDRLHGRSPSATQGIVDRWFHARVWPFDQPSLAGHPLADLEPELLPILDGLRADILAAAAAPFGVIHSDLHRQHLLRQGDELSAVLDFDAFIGSTAWDVALLHWYYGPDHAKRVVRAYGADDDLAARGRLLAVAVGCYKVAKSPTDDTLPPRLHAVLDTIPNRKQHP